MSKISNPLKEAYNIANQDVIETFFSKLFDKKEDKKDNKKE